jgi:hypothetical protein
MGRLPGTLSCGCSALSPVFGISQVGAHQAYQLRSACTLPSAAEHYGRRFLKTSLTTIRGIGALPQRGVLLCSEGTNRAIAAAQCKPYQSVTTSPLAPAAWPGCPGSSWSAGEDERLCAAFQAGEAIAAIAASHERKIGAITARLVRLGLITEDGVVQPG